MADIPVYLIAGFLDGGKTEFYQRHFRGRLCPRGQDPADLLRRGRAGEYEQKALDNVTVVTVDEEDGADLLACCKELGKEVQTPSRCIIEYNGMWSDGAAVPGGAARQLGALSGDDVRADANTFEMYAKNMGQIMMEKITNADLLVFNRCDGRARRALCAKRNLRMVNRRADIYLEDLRGQQRGLQLTGDDVSRLIMAPEGH